MDREADNHTRLEKLNALMQENGKLRRERDRALEAVGELRDTLTKIRDRDWVENALDPQWPALISGVTLAATDPATVELPKCDHCGTSCGTDCDGSSHYTPEKKE